MRLSELIELAGEDIRWHTLMQNVTNVTAGKRGENKVTFVTPYVSPHDAIAPRQSQYLALVIYLPRDTLPEEYK